MNETREMTLHEVANQFGPQHGAARELRELLAKVDALEQDAERLDFILPLLELAEGDGNAVATRIGGAILLGLQGRAAIDAARKEPR